MMAQTITAMRTAIIISAMKIMIIIVGSASEPSDNALFAAGRQTQIAHRAMTVGKPYKELSYRGDSLGRRSSRRSPSFKVTDSGTNRKPVCDFLLVNNTNIVNIIRVRTFYLAPLPSYCAVLVKLSALIRGASR